MRFIVLPLLGFAWICVVAPGSALAVKQVFSLRVSLHSNHGCSRSYSSRSQSGTASLIISGMDAKLYVQLKQTHTFGSRRFPRPTITRKETTRRYAGVAKRRVDSWIVELQRCGGPGWQGCVAKTQLAFLCSERTKPAYPLSPNGDRLARTETTRPVPVLACVPQTPLPDELKPLLHDKLLLLSRRTLELYRHTGRYAIGAPRGDYLRASN